MFDHVPSKHNFHRMCTIIYEIKRSKVWSLYMTLKFLATAKLFFGILYALMVEKLWTQDSEYRPMDSCILRISRQSELRHKTRRQVWGSWRLWRRAGRHPSGHREKHSAHTRGGLARPGAPAMAPARRHPPEPEPGQFPDPDQRKGHPSTSCFFMSLDNLSQLQKLLMV